MKRKRKEKEVQRDGIPTEMEYIFTCSNFKR